MLPTRFTSLLGCRVPLQQAGMGGIATPPLVLAVANAGGLGILSGVMVPPPILAEMLEGLAKSARGAVRGVLPHALPRPRCGRGRGDASASRRVLPCRPRPDTRRDGACRRCARLLAGRIGRGGCRCGAGGV